MKLRLTIAMLLTLLPTLAYARPRTQGAHLHSQFSHDRTPHAHVHSFKPHAGR